MSVSVYTDRGALKITALNLESLKDKSVVITGGQGCSHAVQWKKLTRISGASGLGKAYAVAFAQAG